MNVTIHDAEGRTFPNLALMKISAWHKARGDSVAWYSAMFPGDKVYSSKVFTFTPEDIYLPATAEKGGIGRSMFNALPDEIDRMCPDYDLYGAKQSYGFLTRGCPNKCAWCIVPKKEGAIRAYADIEEFARHRDVILMDNNVLAHEHGLDQIDKIARMGLKVDFNQGLDARLIDDGIARLLSRVSWLHPLRLACDSSAQIQAIQKAVTLLRWHNVTPRTYFVYTLVNDIDEALERVRFLKGMVLDPFAQPYRDFTTNQEPTQEQKRFARWVNHKAIFKTVAWEDYAV